MNTNNPLLLPATRIPRYQFAGSVVINGTLFFSELRYGYRAAIIYFRDMVVKRGLVCIGQLIQLPIYEKFEYLNISDFFRSQNIYLYTPFTCFDDLLKFISLMAYYVTHSRVTVDTLRYYATHFQLYSDSPLLPRFQSHQPIKGA